MVKITNPLGDVKIGRQGEVVYQRKYSEQIRRQASPKRAIASQRQIAHRQLYRDALTWRSQLTLANRRYLDGYCYTNRVVDSYHIPLPWSRFALKVYLQAVKFVPDLEVVTYPGTKPETPEASNGASGDDRLYGTRWGSQAFTPTETFTILKVIPRIYKIGSVPSSGTFRIRLANPSHEPTGSELTSGTYDPTTLTTSSDGEFKEIDVTPYELQEAIEYCLEGLPAGAHWENSVRWVRMSGEPMGVNTHKYTLDNGQTWQTYGGTNLQFKMEAQTTPEVKQKEGLLHVRHPALKKVVHKREGLTINGYDTLSSLDDEYLTGQVGLDVIEGDSIEATTLPGIKYSYQVL